MKKTLLWILLGSCFFFYTSLTFPQGSSAKNYSSDYDQRSPILEAHCYSNLYEFKSIEALYQEANAAKRTVAMKELS